MAKRLPRELAALLWGKQVPGRLTLSFVTSDYTNSQRPAYFCPLGVGIKGCHHTRLWLL